MGFSIFGKVPNHWTVCKIGEVVNLRQGLQISSKLRTSTQLDGYIPLLKITDLPSRTFSEFVTDIKEQYIANKKDIIYTRTGQVGLVYTDVEGCVHNNCFKVEYDNTQLDKNYLFYYLNNSIFKELANNVASGSVQKDLTHTAFKTLPFAYPDIKIQRKIANVLNILDYKISLNLDIIKNLEELSQTLFKHWFIEFEFPNEEGLPYKSFDGKMKDSEFGVIPEGWHVGTAKEIFDFSPTEKVKKGEVVPYVEMKNLNTSAMIFDWIDREFSGSGSKFRQGDTLLARITPCLENGKIGYVDFLKENEIGWGSTEFIVIRSKHGIKKSFSYYFASESNFKDYAVSNMNGSSGRQRVKAETLADYKMIIPPIEIINKYTEVTERNMNLMSNLKKQILYLQELRDSLLPKLFSGEIEIPGESVVD